nr:hypothetical protein [Paenibacillus curdlanolyticus]
MHAIYRGYAALMLMTVLWLLWSGPSSQASAAKPVELIQLTFIVHVDDTADMSSWLTINSPTLTREIKHARWQTYTAQPVLYPDLEVELSQGVHHATYRLSEDGRLWNAANQQLLELPVKTANTMKALAQTVRGQYYGRKLPWDEVRRLIPNKSIFTVTDLQTGLRFRVQRRAGSDHADVQPVTKADTRIMKQIFNGEWSWNRRAILVRTDMDWIAASMNGMPHGGDGIPDNDFSGHFCIHFYLSTTHKSDTPDLAHQLMVHKASGELQSYLDDADPLLIARSYIEALNHRDRAIVHQITLGMQEDQFNNALTRMDALDSIRDTTNRRRNHSATSGGKSNEWNNQLTAEVQLPVAYRMKGGAQHNTMFHFTFNRPSTSAPWRLVRIDTDSSRNVNNPQ